MKFKSFLLLPAFSLPLAIIASPIHSRGDHGPSDGHNGMKNAEQDLCVSAVNDELLCGNIKSNSDAKATVDIDQAGPRANVERSQVQGSDQALGAWCWCKATNDCDCTDGETVGEVQGRVVMRADGAFDTIAWWNGKQENANKEGQQVGEAAGQWCWCNEAGENCDCNDGEIIGSIKGRIMMRADGVFDTLVEWKGVNDTTPVEKRELNSLQKGDEEWQDIDGTDDQEHHKSEHDNDEEYVNEDSIGDNGGDTEESSNDESTSFMTLPTKSLMGSVQKNVVPAHPPKKSEPSSTFAESVTYTEGTTFSLTPALAGRDETSVGSTTTESATQTETSTDGHEPHLTMCWV